MFFLLSIWWHGSAKYDAAYCAYIFVSATSKSDECWIWRDSPHRANIECEKSQTELWNIDNRDTISNRGHWKANTFWPHPNISCENKRLYFSWNRKITNDSWKIHLKVISWFSFSPIFCKLSLKCWQWSNWTTQTRTLIYFCEYST